MTLHCIPFSPPQQHDNPFDLAQCLAPNLKLACALPEFATPEWLLDIYEQMLIVRQLDEKATILQRTGQLGTYPSSHGHEGISVTLGKTILSEDIFVPYYRDQGVLLQRDMRPRDILQYWGGDERANLHGNHRDMPVCIPIATQCTHAAGIAYALQYQNSEQVVVCSLGDGATSKGDFAEALNFSSVKNLPIVYVISNNQWAISVPLEAQTAAKTLAHKAYAAGCHAFRVDGGDVIALAHTFQLALDTCRTHQGPILIEAVTYRLCDHTTADDASRYMPEAEREAAMKIESIKRLEDYLHQENILNANKIKSLHSKAKQHIEDEAAAAAQLNEAEAVEIFDSLYADLPNELKNQRTHCIHKAQSCKKN